MPKKIIPLADIQVKNAKPTDKPYKLSDGGGLYVEIMPVGSKLWRMKFRQANGKEERLSFRAYPAVSLADARKKRTDVQNLMAKKTDRAQAKRIEKEAQAVANANTFEAGRRKPHRSTI